MIKRTTKNFICCRCGQCCRQPGYVYLTSLEAEKASGCLEMEPFDFVNQYCDLQDRQKLVLKKEKDETCIFLSGEGCRIQTAKPQQCLDFPLVWRTPRSSDYCRGRQILRGVE